MFVFFGGGGLLKTPAAHPTLPVYIYGRKICRIYTGLDYGTGCSWLTNTPVATPADEQTTAAERKEKKISHKVATGQLDLELVSK